MVIIEEVSLGVLVSFEEHGYVLGGTSGKDSLLLKALNSDNNIADRCQYDLLALLRAITSICEVTAVQHNKILVGVRAAGRVNLSGH